MITIMTRDGRTVSHKKGVVIARFWNKVENEREAAQKIAKKTAKNGV